jgi:hypothetical protein
MSSSASSEASVHLQTLDRYSELFTGADAEVYCARWWSWAAERLPGHVVREVAKKRKVLGEYERLNMDRALRHEEIVNAAADVRRDVRREYNMDLEITGGRHRSTVGWEKNEV